MPSTTQALYSGIAVSRAGCKSRTTSIRADVVAREYQLNARQALLVDAFIREKRLTLAACELLLPETNRRTLQRDLRGLVAKGLIREVGQPTDPTRHYAWLEL